MLQKLQLPEIHSNQSTFFFCCFSCICNTSVIIMTLAVPTLSDKCAGYIDSLNIPLWLFQKQVPFQKTSRHLFPFLCRILNIFSDNLTHFFVFE